MKHQIVNKFLITIFRLRRKKLRDRKLYKKSLPGKDGKFQRKSPFEAPKFDDNLFLAM